MKKVKIFLIVLLACGLLYVGDMFLGNPISYLMVKQHSREYIREKYPAELQLQLGDIYHDWYNGGGYDIEVTSPVSQDTRFSLSYDRLGRLNWDSYEMSVASGNSTLSRLYTEYAVLVDAALGDMIGNNICKPSLSAIDIYSGEPVPLPQGIDQAALVLDAEYDVAVLGKEYGYLSLDIYDTAENISVEKAAEYLLKIKTAMDEAEVGFYSIDLFMIEQDTKDSEKSLLLNGITYEDLNAENVISRLTKRWEQQQ